ncbi:hypothetical protein E3P99_02481 [Wallemia hederae]|uniref:Ubiquitin-like domain-containing protein n=1 Tax=Wallemia hederae TaxID=1540922 RepID=A0A4T0FKU3_9BASI|nr:hypothetical protein E3P99_02481 [Wallemia hederae]
MKLTILSNSSKPSHTFPVNLELAESATGITVSQLKSQIHAKVPKLYPSRQRILNVNKEVLKDDAATLSHYNINNGDILYIKDLGPQVSWTTVFLVEYAGPLLIHPLFYHFSSLIYRKQFTPSDMQTLAYILILIHFIKREVETVFVHRFSNATMPFMNIFRNSAHYHLLSGLLIAVAIYGPWYSVDALRDSHRSNPNYLAFWLAVWVFCQVSNLITHIKLRNLRPAGTKERNIPMGYGFNMVTCANYFFEIGGWVAILGITGSWAVAIFLLVSAVTMAKWAKKKDQLYRKQFGDKYPRNRRILFPYIW